MGVVRRLPIHAAREARGLRRHGQAAGVHGLREAAPGRRTAGLLLLQVRGALGQPVVIFAAAPMFDVSVVRPSRPVRIVDWSI